MKEKIKKLLKWIFLVAVAILLFYFLFPKFYFIKSDSVLIRCNKITGSCDIRRSGSNYWENLVK